MGIVKWTSFGNTQVRKHLARSMYSEVDCASHFEIAALAKRYWEVVGEVLACVSDEHKIWYMGTLRLKDLLRVMATKSISCRIDERMSIRFLVCTFPLATWTPRYGPFVSMHAITATRNVKGYVYPFNCKHNTFWMPISCRRSWRNPDTPTHDRLHVLEDLLLELTLDLQRLLAWLLQTMCTIVLPSVQSRPGWTLREDQGEHPSRTWAA